MQRHTLRAKFIFQVQKTRNERALIFSIMSSNNCTLCQEECQTYLLRSERQKIVYSVLCLDWNYVLGSIISGEIQIVGRNNFYRSFLGTFNATHSASSVLPIYTLALTYLVEVLNVVNKWPKIEQLSPHHFRLKVYENPKETASFIVYFYYSILY